MSAEVVGYIVNLLGVIASALEIYFYVLLIRVLLSWFPNLDQSNPVVSTLISITDPYLNAFRGIIPPPWRAGFIRPARIHCLERSAMGPWQRPNGPSQLSSLLQLIHGSRFDNA